MNFRYCCISMDKNTTQGYFQVQNPKKCIKKSKKFDFWPILTTFEFFEKVGSEPFLQFDIAIPVNVFGLTSNFSSPVFGLVCRNNKLGATKRNCELVRGLKVGFGQYFDAKSPKLDNLCLYVLLMLKYHYQGGISSGIRNTQFRTARV